MASEKYKATEYKQFLVIYTTAEDRLLKIQKINRGDTRGFTYLGTDKLRREEILRHYDITEADLIQENEDE